MKNTKITDKNLIILPTAVTVVVINGSPNKCNIVTVLTITSLDQGQQW